MKFQSQNIQLSSIFQEKLKLILFRHHALCTINSQYFQIHIKIYINDVYSYDRCDKNVTKAKIDSIVFIDFGLTARESLIIIFSMYKRSELYFWTHATKKKINKCFWSSMVALIKLHLFYHLNMLSMPFADLAESIVIIIFIILFHNESHSRS